MGRISQLTVITINRNNSEGLEKTMKSVLKQACPEFEYVLIDGASTDDSVAVIRRYAPSFGDRLKWVSEPDKGIYNAMNKGILMATGEYVQFLNSGDCLASEDVVSKMYAALDEKRRPSILYGNMLKDMPNGTVQRDNCFAGKDITFLGFYTGTLNHSPAYIRRDLFDKYGLYDESLKIVSDWKWYLQAIVLGEEVPAYVDLDVTLFDMHGISETNLGLRDEEKHREMKALVKSSFLKDYELWSFPIEQMQRLKRHPWAYKLVWFLERVLFTIEKFNRRRSGEVQYL